MPKRPPKRASRPSLDPIFRPRSVAVIGASRRHQTIGREILANLVGFEFTGPVYPVNPGAASIHSIPCFPSIAAIPGAVDLAIITVPKDRVLEVVEACGRKGVGGLVVITAGFREVGRAGQQLEAALKATLGKYRMRMIGPNCMGVVNTEPDVRLNATFAATVPVRGNVGFMSQSGALGEAILADAADNGLGVAMFVSMGNKTDVSGNDLLEYWEDNPDVQAILMYLESFGNPRRFTTIARRVTRKKPIIAVKAGRTVRGAQAASSHTGSIVALDTATDTLLEQCGVLRVSSMEEMISLAQALANQPVPAGSRIAIVTNAGGPGILCTDALIGAGLSLAELRPKTRRAWAKPLPPEASTANPVDMIASADATRYQAALDLVRRDPGVDGIIAIFVSPIMIDAYEVARAIAAAADGAKPVLSVFMGKQRSAEGLAWLRDRRVPVYRFPEDAAAAMFGLARYRELRDRPAGKTVKFKAHPARARKAIAAARRARRAMLSPEETAEVLSAYGFALAPSRLAASAGEAIDAAHAFGYPVVLKAASDRISHKSDVGGVKVDLRNADEVALAFREIVSKLRSKDPKLKVQVQPMITGGRETILGMSRDPQFGPVLMFGLGGIFVEVMKDVAIRIHPLTDVNARGMIERIKGYPLLAGARGDAPVDLRFLEESLLRLSQLVGDLEDDLEGLDLNPLIVTSDRKRSFVVDARIALTPRS
jgi:acetyl coenzyme A synthetase (ADP forming)-like protein